MSAIGDARRPAGARWKERLPARHGPVRPTPPRRFSVQPFEIIGQIGAPRCRPAFFASSHSFREHVMRERARRNAATHYLGNCPDWGPKDVVYLQSLQLTRPLQP